MPNTDIEDPQAREEADFVALENELNDMEAEVDYADYCEDAMFGQLGDLVHLPRLAGCALPLV